MNAWKEICYAYHKSATRRNIIYGIVKEATWADRLYLLFLSLVFFVCFILHTLEYGFWLVPTMAAEMAALLKLSKLKENLVLNEYGGFENSKAPYGSDSHQATRYLMFKTALQEKNLNKDYVKDCFDLVESQIDIQKTEFSGFKKASSFVFGILAGVLTALWKQLDTSALIYIVLGISCIAVFIYLISSVFPSELEKKKELKYFMLLVCKEV